jgi:hypothetical protein
VSTRTNEPASCGAALPDTDGETNLMPSRQLLNQPASDLLSSGPTEKDLPAALRRDRIEL